MPFSSKSVGTSALSLESPTAPQPSYSGGTSKPVVVMVHGMWSTPAVWAQYRTVFEAAGYRVLTPELRHHTYLREDQPAAEFGRTSLRDYVADVEACLAQLDAPAILVGHSMGGLIAQMVAKRNTVLALVLLGTAGIAGHVPFTNLSTLRIFWRQALTFGFWRKPQMPDYSSIRFGVLNGLEKTAAQVLYDQFVWESGRTLFEIAFYPLDSFGTTEIEAGEIDCPVLLMTGTKDRICPASIGRSLAAYYPNAEFRAQKNMAHWLLSEPGWESVAQQALTFCDTQANRHAQSQGV